jgi:hypothetical protein
MRKLGALATVISWMVLLFAFFYFGIKATYGLGYADGLEKNECDRSKCMPLILQYSKCD